MIGKTSLFTNNVWQYSGTSPSKSSTSRCNNSLLKYKDTSLSDPKLYILTGGHKAYYKEVNMQASRYCNLCPYIHVILLNAHTPLPFYLSLTMESRLILRTYHFSLEHRQRHALSLHPASGSPPLLYR